LPRLWCRSALLHSPWRAAAAPAPRRHRRQRQLRERDDARITSYEGATPIEITERLGELDREWEIQRVLQANAGTLALAGKLLDVRYDRRLLMLPGLVYSFFLVHGLQGWCPPIPLFRCLGVRTSREIDRERYALKVLRDDFEKVPAPGLGEPEARVQAVLRAVDA
jgi:hypothetical protein